MVNGKNLRNSVYTAVQPIAIVISAFLRIPGHILFLLYSIYIFRYLRKHNWHFRKYSRQFGSFAAKIYGRARKYIPARRCLSNRSKTKFKVIKSSAKNIYRSIGKHISVLWFACFEIKSLITLALLVQSLQNFRSTFTLY